MRDPQLVNWLVWDLREKVKELHRNDVIHGDLHLGNVLIDDKVYPPKLYLIDFDNYIDFKLKTDVFKRVLDVNDLYHIGLSSHEVDPLTIENENRVINFIFDIITRNDMAMSEKT